MGAVIYPASIGLGACHDLHLPHPSSDLLRRIASIVHRLGIQVMKYKSELPIHYASLTRGEVWLISFATAGALMCFVLAAICEVQL
jgi:hypothetical protein